MSSGKKGQRWPIAKKQPKYTLAQSIALGQSLLVAGDLPAAEHVLTSILAAMPDEPDALHLLGALRNMQYRPADALPLLRKAIELRPDDPGRWNDLGLVLAQLSRQSEAMEAYQRCIQLAGKTLLTAKAFDNLGRLQIKNDVRGAEASFLSAIDAAPGFGLPWYGLARALIHQDNVKEGLEASAKAEALMPKSMSRELVAMALVRLGDIPAAIAYYQRWLQDDPDNPLIRHPLKALMDPGSAERASDAYIELTFDHFAFSFDAKLAQLDYRAPQLVHEALLRIYPQAQAALDIADAGCGTGLCGPQVRPWARRLCGFDLSAGMLAQAKRREVYDDLHRAELVSFLDGHPDAFDVVISADTLCYFGSLEGVMEACYKAVRPGGYVIFTVEALDDGDQLHRLAPSGRYAHSRAHVTSAAQNANLQIGSIEPVALRNESGVPVNGWLVTLKRP